MAAPMRGFGRVPVVVVLGATGTGKSKLALEIGRRLNGEIISADSMQVYKGLDIITNKVTPEERKQCPHHVIDYVDPLSRYTVVDFRNKAVPIIDDVLSRQKLPIIVGGTNYYIESLLWKILIDAKIPGSDELLFEKEEREKVQQKRKNESKIDDLDLIDAKLPKFSEDESLHFDKTMNVTEPSDGVNTSNLAASSNKQEEIRNFLSCVNFEEVSGHELRQKLEEVDSKMATKFHPNDKRKILRSLQVFAEYGVQHSQLLEVQRSETGGSVLGGPLRYENPCILWLQCDQTVLDERLDKRVDDMLRRGLLQELTEFHKDYNQLRLEQSSDSKELYTHGIFQSIGFKEFHKYLILSQEDKDSDEGRTLQVEGVNGLKLATRRYGRKQNRWVRNRFLKRPGGNVPAVYGLDTTDVDQWEETVLQPAFEIVQAVCQGETPSIPPLPHEEAPNIDTNTSHICDVCNGKLIVGQQQWQGHLRSRGHQKRLKKRRQLEELMNKVDDASGNGTDEKT
ncbi:tRNA dimethylallyltransferase-like isoform X2 [Ptychodera flava]|uniref:tRNA dimethylallyltransferase-like isoform X2 n=1 Tax=Ptychodera flava TaxID=63121 RepID=UPI00396AB059